MHIRFINNKLLDIIELHILVSKVTGLLSERPSSLPGREFLLFPPRHMFCQMEIKGLSAESECGHKHLVPRLRMYGPLPHLYLLFTSHHGVSLKQRGEYKLNIFCTNSIKMLYKYSNSEFYNI